MEDKLTLSKTYATILTVLLVAGSAAAQPTNIQTNSSQFHLPSFLQPSQPTPSIRRDANDQARANAITRCNSIGGTVTDTEEERRATADARVRCMIKSGVFSGPRQGWYCAGEAGFWPEVKSCSLDWWTWIGPCPAPPPTPSPGFFGPPFERLANAQCSIRSRVEQQIAAQQPKEAARCNSMQDAQRRFSCLYGAAEQAERMSDCMSSGSFGMTSCLKYAPGGTDCDKIQAFIDVLSRWAYGKELLAKLRKVFAQCNSKGTSEPRQLVAEVERRLAALNRAVEQRGRERLARRDAADAARGYRKVGWNQLVQELAGEKVFVYGLYRKNAQGMSFLRQKSYSYSAGGITETGSVIVLDLRDAAEPVRTALTATTPRPFDAVRTMVQCAVGQMSCGVTIFGTVATCNVEDMGTHALVPHTCIKVEDTRVADDEGTVMHPVPEKVTEAPPLSTSGPQR